MGEEAVPTGAATMKNLVAADTKGNQVRLVLPAWKHQRMCTQRWKRKGTCAFGVEAQSHFRFLRGSASAAWKRKRTCASTLEAQAHVRFQRGNACDANDFNDDELMSRAGPLSPSPLST